MSKSKDYDDEFEGLDEFIELLKECYDEIEDVDVEIIPERAEKVMKDLEALKNVVTGKNITFSMEFGKPFKHDVCIWIKGKNLIIKDPEKFVEITSNIYGNIDFSTDEEGEVEIGILYKGVYEILDGRFENNYIEGEEEILDDRLKNRIMQNENAKNRLINTRELLRIRMHEAGLKEEIPTKIVTVTQAMDGIVEHLWGEFGSEIDVIVREDKRIGFIIREVDLDINDITGDFEYIAKMSDIIYIRDVPRDRNGRVEVEFVVEL